MFLPAAKIRVLESSAGTGKTKIKKNSLLYVVRGGGLSTPVDAEIKRKYNGKIIAMPAKVVVTRYGKETKRRAETKNVSFVFPFIECSEQNKGKCLKTILSELKSYEHHLENLWSYNKNGHFAKNLDYIVGYPTLEETDVLNTVDELSAWLYSIINNLLHYSTSQIAAAFENRNRILNSIYAILPGLKLKLRLDDVGMYSCKHFNDVRSIISNIYNDKDEIDKIIKWGLSQKALMARRLFYHNAKVYGTSTEVRKSIAASMVVPKPVSLHSNGWENIINEGPGSYRKLKYTWMTATNNLPINFKGDIYNKVMPWVDYFKTV